MKKRVVAIAIIVFCCAMKAAAETPQEGAAVILNLLEGRNYSDLFQQRYSDWYKVEAEGVEPEAAIKKLSGFMEKNYDTLIILFENLAHTEFEISTREKSRETEAGDVATATIAIDGKEIPYRLYKMKNGLWGFDM